MTLEELQSMSDEQLNELAATKVMGLHKFDALVRIKNGWNPTTDMNDAMILLDETRKNGIILNIYTWETHFNVTIDGEKGVSHQSLSRAITIASILAKGE